MDGHVLCRGTLRLPTPQFPSQVHVGAQSEQKPSANSEAVQPHCTQPSRKICHEQQPDAASEQLPTNLELSCCLPSSFKITFKEQLENVPHGFNLLEGPEQTQD
jgi:hypothetical protein